MVDGLERALPALGAILMNAACAQAERAVSDPGVSPSPAPSGQVPATSPGDGGPGEALVLARVRGADEGDAALFSGTLVIEDGCAYLDGGDGKMLLVAANDAIAVAGGRVRADGFSFADGDRVEAGGSATATSGLRQLWTVPPPPRCATEQSWLAISLTAPS